MISTDILKHLPTAQLVSTVQQTDDEKEWLRVRTRGIGGSDVGSICGVNKWASALNVYFKKTGQFEEATNNFSDDARERMNFGHILEPVVANEYVKRTGNKVVEAPGTFCHKDHPWMLANVDRLIIDDEGVPVGILECKTASEHLNEDWKEGEVPIYYLYQLTWYMMVTGLKQGAIACLVGGNKYYFYEFFLNEDLAHEIFTKAEFFWKKNVGLMVAPEVASNDDELLADIFPADKTDKEPLTIECEVVDTIAINLAKVKKEIKELEKVAAELQNKLKSELCEHEVANTLNCTFSWKPRKQTRLDTTAFKAAHPELYKEFCNTTSYRVFSVKVHD